MAAPIRFYFDFISPYAYLAWKRIGALAERHDRPLEPVPILFAALLNAHGHKGPAEIPLKKAWVFKDVVRTAHLEGLPLEPPPSHPFNPLLALRVATAAPKAVQVAVIDALYDAVWAGGGGVSDPANVERVAADAGLPGALALGTSPEAKQALRAASDAAAAQGLWGVPTMEVEGEIFWGFDRFHHLEMWLRGEDPIDQALAERWSKVVPSAERPR